MKPVVAAIDFSPVSRRVIKVATELARALGGRVVLLHVVPPPAFAAEIAPLVGEVIQLTAEVERSARRHLKGLQGQLLARGTTVATICCAGAPAPEIIARSTQERADYIVLGSHGHTALFDLVAGSTASRVLKHASTPVVVVPANPGNKKRRKSSRR